MTRMIRTALLAAGIAFAAPAAQAEPGLFEAKTLDEFCSPAADAGKRLACLAYLRGVFESVSMTADLPLCTAGVRYADLPGLYRLQYAARAEPGDSALVIAVSSFITAFYCERK